MRQAPSAKKTRPQLSPTSSIKQNKMPSGKQALPSESEELRRIDITAVKP